jgi:hypothetical protein
MPFDLLRNSASHQFRGSIALPRSADRPVASFGTEVATTPDLGVFSLRGGGTCSGYGKVILPSIPAGRKVLRLLPGANTA